MSVYGPRGRRFSAVTWSALLASVLASVLASMLAGCAASTPRVHAEDDGPLVSQGNGRGGGVSLYAPKVAPWVATVGGNQLCRRDPGDRLVLRRVRWTASSAPLEVTPVLRTVTAAEASAAPPIDVGPVYSALGAPPEWDEPYAYFDQPPLGTVSSDIAGRSIDQPCTQLRDPAKGFTELLLVVESGRAGAELTDIRVDYTRDDRDHTLVIEHTMILCGTRVRNHCEP